MKTVFWFCFAGLLSSSHANAFADRAFGLGGGYYSQNILNRTSQSETGKTGFLGTTMNPVLIMSYDYRFGMDWFVAPRLDYALFGRSTAGDTAKVTFMHLMIPFGKSIGDFNSKWDWYAGPGVMQYKITGSGGTTKMNNGTGTAVFAVPGNDATIMKVTTNLGAALNVWHGRLAGDLVIENLFSSTKRAESLMLSYVYKFGDRL